MNNNKKYGGICRNASLFKQIGSSRNIISPIHYGYCVWCTFLRNQNSPPINIVETVLARTVSRCVQTISNLFEYFLSIRFNFVSFVSVTNTYIVQLFVLSLRISVSMVHGCKQTTEHEIKQTKQCNIGKLNGKK